MRAAGCILLVAVAAACGPPPPPAYITDVRALSAGPASQDARKKAPELWKRASDALEAAIEAHGSGDEAAARGLALEASILFKTALAVTRHKKAEARIAAAEDRISEAGRLIKKFRSLRIDSQNRYLELLEFHESQKDAARTSLAAFNEDREKFEKMDEEQKKTWLSAESKRIARTMQAARSAIVVAELLGCAKLLPSETKEAGESLAKAEKALDTEWELLRPLADEAWLRAERLLVHTRALGKPQALSNPASDPLNVERFVKATGGTGIMVSATSKGILLSLRNPYDDKAGELRKKALDALAEVISAAGKTDSLVIALMAYRSDGCTAGDCLEDSQAMAKQAADAIAGAGVPGSSISHRGWGQEPPPDPGHCLAEPCPGGRLDVIIVNM